MRIGVYCLAKNTLEFVERWEASCRDADVRVVTDTGSTDGTPEELRGLGVTVVESRIVPWRWDSAHTQSLNNLPENLDFCVRLDMDEALVDGWREIIERAVAATSPTKIMHWYEWGPGVRFKLDRFHARDSYRWTGATHEGLVRWHGEERTCHIPDLLIVQAPRDREASRRESDITLLETAVREAPSDSRMRWYLAREYGYAGRSDDATREFISYLALPDGSDCERAYACRELSLLEPTKARYWLKRAYYESPREPEAACRLMFDCRSKGDHAGAFYWGCFAIQASETSMQHTSDPNAYGPTPWAWTAEAAAGCGQFSNAARIVRDGLKKFPDDEALQRLSESLDIETDGPER